MNAKKFHPDKLKDNDKKIESVIEFSKLLVQANGVLLMDERKAEYDKCYKNAKKELCSLCAKKKPVNMTHICSYDLCL